MCHPSSVCPFVETETPNLHIFWMDFMFISFLAWLETWLLFLKILRRLSLNPTSLHSWSADFVTLTHALMPCSLDLTFDFFLSHFIHPNTFDWTQSLFFSSRFCVVTLVKSSQLFYRNPSALFKGTTSGKTISYDRWFEHNNALYSSID